MKRIAAPMVGGLVTWFLLDLLVHPAVCSLWKRRAFHSSALDVFGATLMTTHRRNA